MLKTLQVQVKTQSAPFDRVSWCPNIKNMAYPQLALTCLWQLALEVLALLVALVFSTNNLTWSPLDHFETFAGAQSITKGEKQVGGPMLNRL